MRTNIAVCFAFLWTTSTALTQPSGEAPRDIIVKAAKLTPELTIAAAQIGEGLTIDVEPGSDILEVIAKHCGTANARRFYLPLFLAANSANEEIQKGITVLAHRAILNIPGCLYANDKYVKINSSLSGLRWERPVLVPETAVIRASDNVAGQQVTVDASINLDRTTGGVQPGQSVDFERLKSPAGKELPGELRELGVDLVKIMNSSRLADPEVRSQYDKLLVVALANTSPSVDSLRRIRASALERSLRTQDVMAANAATDFSTLPSDASVVSSDFVGGAYPLRVKPDVSEQDIRKAFEAARSRDPQLGIDIPSEYEPYFAVPANTDSPACAPLSEREWPINIEELKMVLDWRQRVDNRPVSGRLFVFDTGFPKGKTADSPFSQRYFIQDKSAPDGDVDKYLWKHGAEYFYDGATDASHGVSVITLALGGLGVLRSNVLDGKILSQGGTVISFNGYKRSDNADNRLIVDKNAVGRTFNGMNWAHAGYNSVLGINMSLKFSLEALKKSGISYNAHFAKSPDVLFVFAAGNESQRVSGQIYPAAWGGSVNPNVITVAAIDPNQKYWAKSNQGPENVDIAAPGCGVPTLQWSAVNGFEEVALNGTSFAAPLVSFAGNLLREYTSGAVIKNRIISSGRYSSDLQDVVYSKRYLDVPNALATPFDTVRMGNGQLRIGRANWRSGVICGTQRKRSGLRQIHRALPDKTTVHMVKKNELEPFVISFEGPCKLGATELTEISFQEAEFVNARVSLSQKVDKLNIREIQSITLCDHKCEFPIQ